MDNRTLREINAEVRRAERAAASKRREAALADKQSRETKAIRKTGRVQAQFAALNTLLTSTAGESFSFDRLKVVPEQRSFNPGALAHAEQEPRGLRSLLPGAARKHREQLEKADRAFAEACEQHEAREAQRLQALKLARDEFDAKTAELEEIARRQHVDADQLESRFREGDPAAVADGGVHCVAYDARPVLGGKVVIQARRYKNTVGVNAVRDLFGTVHNEGASKGILVTTSGYGQASYEFANGKPLELLDGGNLLSLLQEHAGIEAKIVPPEDWVDPVPDA